MTTLPKTLQTYVDHMARENRPVDFGELFEQTPRVNCVRFLHKRGLIRDVNPNYREGDAYEGPRVPQYVLTEAGKSHVTKP